MKTIKYFVGLAFVLFASFFVVSCNDDIEETLEQQWASVLDNHGCNYDYSDDGKCFGDGGGISKENFDKVIVFVDGSVTSVTQRCAENSGQNHIVFLFVCLFVCMFVSSKLGKSALLT